LDGDLMLGFRPFALSIIQSILRRSDSFILLFSAGNFIGLTPNRQQQLNNVLSPSNSTVSPLMTQSLGKRGNAGRWSTLDTAACIRFGLRKRPKKSQSTDVSKGRLHDAAPEILSALHRWCCVVPIAQTLPWPYRISRTVKPRRMG
jgi:hypothetical protein